MINDKTNATKTTKKTCVFLGTIIFNIEWRGRKKVHLHKGFFMKVPFVLHVPGLLKYETDMSVSINRQQEVNI